jgi:hypothetical protein
MTIEAGSGRNPGKGPGAVISARAAGPARRPRAASRQHGVVWFRIGLAALVHVLRSRRFHERVIIGVIGLAAAASLGWETQARALARLAAWDKARRWS